MAEMGENVPAYRMIKVTGPQGPVEAVVDVEAWRARASYPDILGLGGPVFGVCREHEAGGWELLDAFSGLAPQESRDDMGAVLRLRGKEVRAAGDVAGHDECLRAADRLEWERLDELTVLGTRYRVVRAERFIRTGPDGPEPPRPSDPDPAGPGEHYRADWDENGYIIDPAQPTAAAEGALKIELLSLICTADAVPPDVRQDSVRAATTHPGGVLLPATFMTAERTGGRWVPDSAGVETTPQQARDGLAMGLRVMIPWRLGLTEEEREPYLRAADRLDETRADELDVLGRRFRVVRVERLVRVGPDGPEGPRPSDRDPYPPVGLLGEPESEAAASQPIELDEDTQRLSDMLDTERARDRTRRGNRTKRRKR
ncbi:DUF5954 family protein [Streptomyces sp. NPDC057702]|uniref:DUF5954 family protein n=1 Tax=unclassified Streptomyces TaxID=2593676 RepID=UPI0036976DBC